MPDFAPASIAMLHMDMRLSMLIVSIGLPVNSIALYRAPSTPMSPMMWSIRSLPLTHFLSLPLKTNFIVSGTLNHILPVIMAAARSVEPTPVENAPSAP